MTNHKVPEEAKSTKRRKLLTSILEDDVNTDEDDLSMDTFTICNIIEDQDVQEIERNEHSSRAIRNLGETIRSTLLEINQIREDNRERRHRELLDVLNKVINSETLHQDDRTLVPCQIDNHNEHEGNLSDHFVVEEIVNDDMENIHSISRTDNAKNTASVNVSLEHECPTTSVPESSCLNQNTNMVVAAKKDTKVLGDLKLMRVKMLEMQRKKMEDRVRKKRDCLQVKKT